MSEKDKNRGEGQAEPDEMWDDLKGRAHSLVSTLENKDFNSVSEAIQQLTEVRDRSIYLEVGKLTRGLHDAIVNFEISPGTSEAAEGAEVHESQMVNAKDRLEYVLNLTQSSADKTMDMVEEGIPITSGLNVKAKALRVDLGRLMRREMQTGEFKDLVHGLDEYLEQSVSSNERLGQILNEILLAQDFQDLTGQVIKKVSSLVQEVENRLVELMRVAGHVEELTGVVCAEEPAEAANLNPSGEAEGPQINAEQRDDVVSGQDDVDDLLSSLGF